ncbi:MAG: DsbE family thiol:disulfide interchange protein [Hyphomonadaceae bacterium]|nr:DsbE family thiol:disulfide interchange protein [Hyphomonadaceae bacterium]MBC6413265.1 DsbE family thiol:disulfide interchange protein [Hyphomonadaceae bacterium]
MKGFLPLVVFAGIVGALALGLTRDPRILPSELINKPFPEFELSDLHNADATLTKDVLGDRVSLVNVFGSWCMACVQEHPKLMELSGSGVNIIGINWRDSRSKGLQWLDTHGNPYARVIYDPYSRLAIDLGITGAPETFVVDRDGNIRYRHVGIVSDDVWKTRLRPAIEQIKAQS